MRLLLVVIALTSMAPWAAAETSSVVADLEVRGLVTFTGVADMTARWSGSMRETRLGHMPLDGAFHFQGTAAQINYTYGYVETPTSSPIGYKKHRQLLTEEHSQAAPLVGAISFAEPGPQASVRIIPLRDQPMHVGGDFTLNASRDLHSTLAHRNDAEPLPGSSDHYPRPGGILTGPTIPLEGVEVLVVVTDYVLHEPSGVIDSRWSPEGASIGDAGATLQRTSVILLKGKVWSEPLDTSWTHTISGLSGSVVGDLTLFNAQGQGTLDGTALRPGIQMIQVAGTIQVEAAYGSSPARWHLDGFAAFLAVNAETVAGSRFGAGLAAVGVFAVLALFLKSIVTLVLGRSTPRLVKVRVLPNRARQAILSAIHQKQPITLVELRSATQISRGALRYHLRILNAHGLIDAVLPPGHERRNQSFMLNSGSLKFGVTDEGIHKADQVLSFVNANPIRQAIVALLQSGRELGIDELRQGLIQSGRVVAWPPSSASYHLNGLRSAGAIVERQVGTKKFYRTAIDLRRLRQEQYRRFLDGHGLTATMTVVSTRGPICLQDVASALRLPITQAKSLLEQLRAFALVHYDSRSGAYQAIGEPVV